VQEHDRARAEMLTNDARTALEEQAPIDRLRSLSSELHQMAQALSSTVRGQSQAGPSADAGESGPGDASDDVIDAEFTAH
ncbi:MAG: molecular chaperone DnaK, partial [Mycetocola sp.]